MVIDVAPIVRANADCRAAHSITGLTGCNPTCIPAPAAFPGQWVDAQESSNATGVPHIACRAGVRPITSQPILQRNQTPTGGELRGDHHQQRDDQKPSVYCFWHSTILFGASFFWFSPRLDAQAVGPSSMCTLPAERECNHGNDTLRLCGFLPHWQCALWLRARLHGVHQWVSGLLLATCRR